MTLQNSIGKLLRTGVLVAAVVVQAGGVAYLISHGREPAAYSVFHGESSDLRSVPGIVEGLVHLRSRNVIQFGLLILIATPVMRVVFSLVAFAAERDRTYTMVTGIVLAILLYSLSGGQ